MRRLAALIAALAAATTLVVGGGPAAGATDPTTPEEWVALTYRTCLHREPDPAGLEHWLGRWGIPDRQGAAMQIAGAICFSRESRAPTITDAFTWILGRAPSAEDRAYWVERIPNRDGLRRVERHLFASAERYTASGGTDAAYVDDLYDRVLDRRATTEDRAYWTGRLASGEPRARTVDALIDTEEAARARIVRLAAAAVGRPPTPDELAEAMYPLLVGWDPRNATSNLLEWIAFVVP